MPFGYCVTTSTTLTPPVHIRASISIHPTTTRAWSSRSTPRYGENGTSAASSTSTAGLPDLHENAAHDPRRYIGHGIRRYKRRATAATSDENRTPATADQAEV